MKRDEETERWREKAGLDGEEKENKESGVRTRQVEWRGGYSPFPEQASGQHNEFRSRDGVALEGSSARDEQICQRATNMSGDGDGGLTVRAEASTMV